MIRPFNIAHIIFIRTWIKQMKGSVTKHQISVRRKLVTWRLSAPTGGKPQADVFWPLVPVCVSRSINLSLRAHKLLCAQRPLQIWEFWRSVSVLHSSAFPGFTALVRKHRATAELRFLSVEGVFTSGQSRWSSRWRKAVRATMRHTGCR